jgi:hypothetical protein
MLEMPRSRITLLEEEHVKKKSRLRLGNKSICACSRQAQLVEGCTVVALELLDVGVAQGETIKGTTPSIGWQIVCLCS